MRLGQEQCGPDLTLAICCGHEASTETLSNDMKTKNERVDGRICSAVTMLLQIKKLYRVDGRTTSSIGCNEHIQTAMGQPKTAKPPHLPNVEPM